MRHTARNLSPELKTVLVEAIRDSAELVHGGVAGESVDVPPPEPLAQEWDYDHSGEGRNFLTGDFTAEQMLAHREAYAQAVLAAELMLWRSHADAMAHALEVFEAQGSDKTKALRDYMDFKNSYKKETT